MIYECARCGAQFDADRQANAVCPACQRGRTREDIEIDVLVAAATIEPFRQETVAVLTADNFAFADHRTLFSGLQRLAGLPDDVDEWMARLLGCSVVKALERRMKASPVTYWQDLAWLESMP